MSWQIAHLFPEKVRVSGPARKQGSGKFVFRAWNERWTLFDGPCDSTIWGSLANIGGWGWIALILNLVFWVGLIVGLTLFVVWAIRSAQNPYAAGQQIAKEILQARNVWGEVTHEQYGLILQEIG